MAVTTGQSDISAENTDKVAVPSDLEKKFMEFICSYIRRMVSSGMPAATIVKRLQKITRQMIEKGE